jgi:hypothetical protein
MDTEPKPSGRIPGTPLRNSKWETIVHAIVRGATTREAGVAAGMKDTRYTNGRSKMDGNVSRILGYPEVKERLAEVVAEACRLATIHDAWVLNDIKLLAKANIAHFLARDEHGELQLDYNGLPTVDWRHATQEQMRTVAELSVDDDGRLKMKMRDPGKYLEMLARHRGLLRDEIAFTGNQAGGAPVMRVEFVHADDGRSA